MSPRPRHTFAPMGAELELVRAGYSRPTAKALADVTDPDTRDRIRELVGQVGVTDGAPRVYAIRVLAHKLAGGSRPMPPKSMSGDAVALVELRTTELTRPTPPPH